MGLIYLFPTKDDDPDHIVVTKDSLLLRSYGLPPIFWFYLIAILTIFSFLVLNVWNPAQKMLKIGAGIDIVIAYSLLVLIFIAPIILIGFYFYEKNLKISKNKLSIIHKVFFLPCLTKNYILKKDDQFIVEHFVDSPNMARIKDESAMKAFQNRGYYQLILKQNTKRVFIDRHTNHSQLVKIKRLLDSFAQV